MGVIIFAPEVAALRPLLHTAPFRLQSLQHHALLTFRPAQYRHLFIPSWQRHRIVAETAEFKRNSPVFSYQLYLSRSLPTTSPFSFNVIHVLATSEIAGGRYVSFNEDFNVEIRKEVSFLDISGLNVDLALHDVMEIGMIQALWYYPNRNAHPSPSSTAG
ncbi:uncharacterized protein ARMOST_07605 [Armillaria ostoyae]|uniref:Uncharacterized protein n=1 Tax=Armillaria ostoyae TaxID=47428 RepID=A0A284R6B2_ARMOS|nr:uncharacterized protein ARMOST_07605 [Armillaria ostoyae]